MTAYKITMVDPQGVAHLLEAPDGWNLMEVAVKNGVPGVIGECGGSCACATCHLRIDDAWISRLPPAAEMEKDLLICTAEPATPNSRLGCQIRVTRELEGLIVQIPAQQV